MKIHMVIGEKERRVHNSLERMYVRKVVGHSLDYF
jgi:hypothetical protein